MAKILYANGFEVGSTTYIVYFGIDLNGPLTSVGSTFKKSGAYGGKVQSGDTYSIGFKDVVLYQTDPLNDKYCCGFAWSPQGSGNRSTVIPSTNELLQFSMDSVEFEVAFKDDGTLCIVDSGGTARATSTYTVPNSGSPWIYFDCYVYGHDTAGEVYVAIYEWDSGSSKWVWKEELSATSIDTSSAVFDLGLYNPSGHNDFYYDDFYILGDCTDENDRLGPIEIYAYRSTINSVTPDSGDDLDSGTWANTQNVPIDSNDGRYSGAGDSGYVITNDAGGSAGTGGPNTDANVTGTIIAAMGEWLGETVGGSQDVEQILGNNTDGGTVVATETWTIGITGFGAISESASVVPTKTEYGVIGFGLPSAAPTEDLVPTSIVAAGSHTNETGGAVAYTDVTADDGSYAATTTAPDSFRVAMANPTVALSTTSTTNQRISVIARKYKDTTPTYDGGGNPTFTIAIRETSGGSDLATSGTQTIDADGDQTFTFDWDADILADSDGSEVEVYIASDDAGGGPNKRYVAIEKITWNVNGGAGLAPNTAICYGEIFQIIHQLPSAGATPPRTFLQRMPARHMLMR